MSTQPQGASHSLPEHPNLRHLKDQAKDLLKAGAAKSIASATIDYFSDANGITGECSSGYDPASQQLKGVVMRSLHPSADRSE